MVGTVAEAIRQKSHCSPELQSACAVGHADARVVERVYGKESPADLGRALERIPALAESIVLNLYGAPSKSDDSPESVDSPNSDFPPEIQRAPQDSNLRPSDSKGEDKPRGRRVLIPSLIPI